MTDKKRTKKFAEVILPLAAEGTFTYEVPYDFDYVGSGSRVLVNFGKQKMRSEEHTSELQSPLCI